MSAAVQAEAEWISVCATSDIPREHGVAALLRCGQIAVFRTYDDQFYALDNRDPWTGANVLSRGIVGSRAGRPTVASPLHKQVFELSTGSCLDDPAKSVTAYAVRVSDDGVVQVAVR